MASYWTTNANRDFFDRNILTTWGYGPGSAEARAYNEFCSNAQGVRWPAIEEVTDWVQSTSYQGVSGGDTVDADALQMALDAATSRIAQRCGLYVRPVDADGNLDEDGDPVLIPPEVKLATIMLTARWYGRRQSPSGAVIGANEFAGVVRAAKIDPDIEAMIGNYRQFGLA